MTARIIGPLIGLSLGATQLCAAAIVEITLADKLDEPRGFCLDIVGSQRRAVPARGLQAHTCYSYQGQIAVDQGFSAEELPNGIFHMPGFDVCMTLPDARPGSTLALKACDGGPLQQFTFKDNGTIVFNADRSLCLTVRDGASSPGGGGKPIHLLRRLSVERCNQDLDKFQKWRIRKIAER